MGWLRESEELLLEHVLGYVGAYNLILDLTILEEEEEGDGFYVVFDGELTGFIDVDLADLCLAFDICGELVEDWAYHSARAAPFCPEIYEDR